MTVCVVVAGEYSDYHIVAVFSTRSIADEAVRVLKDAHKLYDSADEVSLDELLDCQGESDARVIEFDVDPAPHPVRFYCVQIDGEGAETGRRERMLFPWSYDAETRSYGTAGAYAASPRSFDVALKAARDALMQAKANAAQGR